MMRNPHKVNIELETLYFCAEVKEIFSKRIVSFDFFVSFFYQEKNENKLRNRLFFRQNRR